MKSCCQDSSRRRFPRILSPLHHLFFFLASSFEIRFGFLFSNITHPSCIWFQFTILLLRFFLFFCLIQNWFFLRWKIQWYTRHEDNEEFERKTTETGRRLSRKKEWRLENFISHRKQYLLRVRHQQYMKKECISSGILSGTFNWKLIENSWVKQIELKPKKKWGKSVDPSLWSLFDPRIFSIFKTLKPAVVW